jgi:sulfatase maturation enzyme AslB (radical SAM superfamily)
MAELSREFQIFAKLGGALCNLDCHYCYYLKKELLYPESRSFRMSDDLLEEYIVSYDNAGHSIFARDRPDYRPAAAPEGFVDLVP